MAKSIENLFSILHYATGLLVVILFIYYYKHLIRERALIFLAIYSLLDILINLFNTYITDKWSTYIWSTFTFIEYSIFTYILYINIKNPIVKRIIVIASILFIVFTSIYNILTNFDSIDSIPIGIETILIIIFSFYFLYEQMNDTSNLFIYSKYQFWVVIGFLIYLAGSFFIFLYASGMEADILKNYWLITNAFYAAMNILFAIAIYIKSKKPNNRIANNLRPYLN